MKPVGWQPGKKYPMVLSIHGGPAGQYGVDWYHEFQVYAAKGWAVFFCNPRGSTGYGAEVRTRHRQQLGRDGLPGRDGGRGCGAEAESLDRSRTGWASPAAAMAAIMTNWIVGHTNRFKAAVTLRSVSNFISDDGTRDGAYGHEDDFKGFLFDDFDQYWDASPLKYAQEREDADAGAAFR